MKIRSKIIGVLFLLSILPIFLVAGASYKFAEQSLTEATLSHYTTTAELKKQEANLWLEDVIGEFQYLLSQVSETVYNYHLIADESMLSGDSYEAHEKEEEAIEKVLDDVTQNRSLFSSISLIEGGTGRVHLSSDPREHDKIFLYDSVFTEGKKGLFVEEITHSLTLGKSIMRMSAPVALKESEEAWVIVTLIDISNLTSVITNYSGLGETGETYLVNRYSQPIGTSRFNRGADSPIINSPLVKDCLKGHDGYGLTNNYRNIPVIGVYRYVPKLDFCLVAEVETSEALKSVKLIKLLIIVLTLLTSLFVLAIGLVFSFQITDPLNKLTSIAELISQGHLKKRFPTKMLEEKDEFSVLARAFDNMANKLSSALIETENILTTMPEALFVLDEKGTVLTANATASSLLKIPPDKLIGESFFSFLITAKDSLKFDLDFLSQKKLTGYHIFLKPRKGEKIPADLSTSRIRKKAGNKLSTKYIVVTRDLRDQKKYAKSRVDEITPLLHKISLGDFTENLDLPESDDEFTDLIISVDLMIENLRELIQENKSKTTQLLASNQTIKEVQKETEAEKVKLEAFLSQIGEGVIAISKDGTILLINPEALKLFGGRMSDLINQPFFNHYRFENEAGETIGPDNFPIQNVVAKQKSVHTTTYFHKHDKTIPLSTTISPILLKGELLGIVGTFRDITKEKEIDQAKSEFVSLASHQMRTPLTGIKWLIQATLMHGDLNPQQLDFLNDALRSNDRMIGLVNDLLNVSRLEAGVVSINPEPVEVVSFVNDLTKEAIPTAKCKDQIIKFIKPKHEVNASFDKLLIAEVISSLLSNAMRYSPEGKTITVGIQDYKNFFRLTVKDQGIGIAKSDQKKLFNRFFRSEKASKLDTTGSGLGLYIVDKVLHICNGKIRCDSKEGKGTTFTVRLPKKGITKSGPKTIIEHRS